MSTGFPVVNRDAIRLALHGTPYLQAAEDMVTAIEEYMVRSLILAGHDKVVVDATHLHAKYSERWLAFRCPGIDAIRVLPKMFDTGPKECIRRAEADDRCDLIPVIERMWKKYREINPWINGSE